MNDSINLSIDLTTNNGDHQLSSDSRASLSTNCSQTSDLNTSELNALEAELEREIAQQMKEDEAAEEETKAQTETTQTNKVHEATVTIASQSKIDNQAAAVQEPTTASPTTPARIIPEHTSHSPSTISLQPFESTNDFVNDMKQPSPFNSPSPVNSDSKRKSWIERASEVDVTTTPLKTRSSMSPNPRQYEEAKTIDGGALKPSHPHRRHGSEVTSRLLLSPNSISLKECMRKAVIHASPSSSLASLAKNFIFSPMPGINPNKSSKIPVLRRLSLEHISESSNTPSKTSSMSEHTKTQLQEKIAHQEQQILQAGILGQQLISEMEAMELKFVHDVKQRDELIQQLKLQQQPTNHDELNAKDEMLREQKIELERANNRLELSETTSTDYKIQIQEQRDELDRLSQQLILSKTKITIFESANLSLKKELEKEKLSSGLNERHQQQISALEERLRLADSKNEHFTQEVKTLKEELSCVSLEAAANLKQSLTFERQLKERTNELMGQNKKLENLVLEKMKDEETYQTNQMKLASALEEAQTEVERLSFMLREEQERSQTLMEQLSSLQARQAAAAFKSPEGSPSRLSISGSAIKKGLNARLSHMQYSSLLSELENELQQEIETIQSPRKSMANHPSKISPTKQTTPPKKKSLSPPKTSETVVAAGKKKSLSPPKSIMSPLKTKKKSLTPPKSNLKAEVAKTTSIVEAIVPIAPVDPLVMMKEQQASQDTSNSARVIPATPSSARPSTAFATPSASQPHRTRADSAPMHGTPSQQHQRPRTLSVEDLSEEGDSPNHPKPESISSFLKSAPSSLLKTNSNKSVLKQPSSAKRLASWFTEKVSEAENKLRPVFATLTQSDDEESENEDDGEDKENVPIERQSSNLAPTPAKTATLNNNIRSTIPGTPIASTNATSLALAFAAPTITPATPITRALSEVEANRVTTSTDATSASSTTAAPTTTSSAADQRVDVLREYFHLATLAVKLSSMNENIKACNFSVHLLYDEAIQQDIPFAHWHLWIETRLNELSAQAEHHQILRPRGQTPIKATKPGTPATTKPTQQANLLPMPKTPLNSAHRTVVTSTPGPARPVFDTPSKTAPVSMPPSASNTPIRPENAATATKPSATPHKVSAVPSTPRAILGENNRANNQPVINATNNLQTPSKLNPATTSVAPHSLSTRTPSVTNSLHRPTVRGASQDRFQQRSVTTPVVPSAMNPNTDTLVKSKNATLTNKPITTALLAASASTVSSTVPSMGTASGSTSLLSKFTNFVTSTPTQTSRHISVMKNQ